MSSSMVPLLVLLGVYNETAVRWQMELTNLRPWWKWLEVYVQLEHWDSYWDGLVSSMSLYFSFFLSFFFHFPL